MLEYKFMNVEEITEKLTEQQRMYINFLAAGKTDTKGKKYTREEFAKMIGVSPETLYRWQRFPGFKLAVFEETLSRRVDYIPQMFDAQIIKSIKGKDTSAFMAMMRQWELLKSDKIDTNTKHEGEVSFTNVIPRNANNSTSS